jgi:basic membrane lipoprotein Med (substrate-binding protein (PBP1-ABC) superfamily)
VWINFNWQKEREKDQA